jgi:hypothetical protein
MKGKFGLVLGVMLVFVGCASTNGKETPVVTEEALEVAEETPVEHLDAKRWKTESEGTATIQHSVDSDGICAITVSGTPEEGWWKANAQYDLEAERGKSYTCVFEAWTSSGIRTVELISYASGGPGDPFELIDLTTTRTTYTFVGKTPPRDDIWPRFAFNCANQLGTFFVKIVSITENS